MFIKSWTLDNYVDNSSKIEFSGEMDSSVQIAGFSADCNSLKPPKSEIQNPDKSEQVLKRLFEQSNNIFLQDFFWALLYSI
jgi:hypothetical protein